MYGGSEHNCLGDRIMPADVSRGVNTVYVAGHLVVSVKAKFSLGCIVLIFTVYSILVHIDRPIFTTVGMSSFQTGRDEQQ